MKFRISLIFILALFSFATVTSVYAVPKMTAEATSWNMGDGYSFCPPENVLLWDEPDTAVWHSDWQGEETQWNFPQVLIVEFDKEVEIDAIGYLPRQDSSNNGDVYEYEFWISSTASITDFHGTDNWTKIAEGEWDYWGETTKYDYQIIEIEPVKTKYVKFVVLDGGGGWACCSNLVFNFTGIENPRVWGFHELLTGNVNVDIKSANDAINDLGEDSFAIKSSSIKYVSLGIIILLMLDAAVFFISILNKKSEQN